MVNDWMFSSYGDPNLIYLVLREQQFKYNTLTSLREYHCIFLLEKYSLKHAPLNTKSN